MQNSERVAKLIFTQLGGKRFKKKTGVKTFINGEEKNGDIFSPNDFAGQQA